MQIIFLFFQTIKSLISDIRHSHDSNKYFKSAEFKKYTKNNYVTWSTLDEKIYGNELIAIDCTNFHPMNLIQNLILAKYLQKIYKKEILVIDKVKNKYRSNLYKSFNITNITYITNLNPIINFYKYLKHFFFLTKKIKDIKQFVNFKLDDIEIGKVSYDDYLRSSFEGTIKTMNYKLFFYFFKSIYTYNEIQKLIKNNNIKYYVTHEIQFNPEAIIFQLFLKKKIQIFCKGIGQTKIGLRLFKNFSQRRYNRASLSKNTYLRLLQNFKRDTFIKKGEEKDKTETVVNNYKFKNNNLSIFPENVHPSSILNFAKCVFTEHGTAGLEYSCFGIPAIVTGDAIYYRTGFALEPRDIDEYKRLISKIHEIPPLSKEQIKKAKLFAFYDIELSRVETKLNSYINTTGKEISNTYWSNLSLNLKNFNFENCRFFKMLNTMLKNKNYNILNFDEL